MRPTLESPAPALSTFIDFFLIQYNLFSFVPRVCICLVFDFLFFFFPWSRICAYFSQKIVCFTLARRCRVAPVSPSRGGMFWLSSNNRHYDSSDSDSESSGDVGTTLWSRPMPSKHRHSSRSSSSNTFWFLRWFSSDPPPAPKRSHHSRHRKSTKYRNRSCRPKSSHSWGFVSSGVFLMPRHSSSSATR